MPTTEELIAKWTRVFEDAYNEGILDGLDEVLASNCAKHSPPVSDFVGLGAYKRDVRETRRVMPEFQLKFEDWVVAGDKVAVRWTIRFKHTSPGLWGTTPTGKDITYTGCNVWHLIDGKIVEIWAYNDYLGLTQQIGLGPKP